VTDRMPGVDWPTACPTSGPRLRSWPAFPAAGVGAADLARVEARERDEVSVRARLYRAGRPRIPLVDRVVILVDDGLATGSTARAACQVARAERAGRVVLAVPVAPVGWEARLGEDADELVAVATPEPFYAVGRFYRDFSPVTDEEVVATLASGA
jgi:putative phosphoribosyl transferase